MLKNKKEIQVSLKKAVVFTVLSCLIVSMATGYIVYAAAGDFYQVITGGQYSGAPTFTVYEQESIYYAKNAWGGISYAGYDAAEIIQAAIDTAQATNGKVLVKNGVYPISTTIQLTNAALVGESRRGTIFDVTANIVGISINADPITAFGPSGLNTFTIKASATTYTSALIEMKVYDDPVLGPNINANFPLRAYNIDIFRSITLSRSGVGLSVVVANATGTSFHTFSDIYIHGLGDGIYMQTLVASSFISFLNFENIVVDYCIRGLHIYDTTDKFGGYGVHNNMFSRIAVQARAETTYAFYLNGGKRNAFFECSTTDLEPTAYSISFVGTANLNKVELGTMPQHGTITGSNTEFHNVRYIVTEYRAIVSTAVDAYSAFFEHGLAGQPTTVVATPLGGYWYNYSWAYNGIDYTTIPVGVHFSAENVNATHSKIISSVTPAICGLSNFYYYVHAHYKP